MPAGVYSTLFCRGYLGSAADAVGLRYTVPAFRVAVVRSVDFRLYGAGEMDFGVGVGGAFSPIVSTVGAAASTSRHWDGDQVFPAGSVMNFSWVSGAAQWHVSGFLLNT